MKSLWKVDGYAEDVLVSFEQRLKRWAIFRRKEIKQALITSKVYSSGDIIVLFRFFSEDFLHDKNESMKNLWPDILSELLGEMGYIHAVDNDRFIKRVAKVEDLNKGGRYKKIHLRIRNTKGERFGKKIRAEKPRVIETKQQRYLIFGKFSYGEGTAVSMACD